MWPKLGWLAVAGICGTLARYGLGGFVNSRLPGAAFPWGTLAVNGIGCFAFGLVWPLAEERLLISGETRQIVLIGFMGAFTTFSSFAFETAQLLRDAEWMLAMGNIMSQNVLGIAFMFLGMAVGRMV